MLPLADPQPGDDFLGLLQRSRRGDAQAQKLLFTQVYSELKSMALRCMIHEKPGYAVPQDAEMLIVEAYVRLMSMNDQPWNGRSHFLAAAAMTIRRIRVDAARQKRIA